jgi:hypothetical protein
MGFWAILGHFRGNMAWNSLKLHFLTYLINPLGLTAPMSAQEHPLTFTRS